MGTVNLFIGVGLREGVKPNDFTLIVEPSELDGVDILRDAEDRINEFLIDSEKTFILGRKEEDINTENHELIIKLELKLNKDVSADDISFIVYDHDFIDGFTVAIHKSKVELPDDNIVIARDSYIIKRIKG